MYVGCMLCKKLYMLTNVNEAGIRYWYYFNKCTDFYKT